MLIQSHDMDHVKFGWQACMFVGETILTCFCQRSNWIMIPRPSLHPNRVHAPPAVFDQWRMIRFIPSIPCSGLNYTLGWGLAHQWRCSDLPGGDFHSWPQVSSFFFVLPHIWHDVQRVDLPAEMFIGILPTRSESEAKGAHGVFGFSDVETLACGMKFPVLFNFLQDCAPT